MKGFIVVLFCIFSFMVFDCATSSQITSIEFDQAIDRAATEIAEGLPPNSKIAIISFSSSNADLSDYVIEELSVSLVNKRKLTVVDRKELDLIRNELDFQISGEVDDKSALSIGNLLGAQYIITGSFINSGSDYRFRINAINVERAVKEASLSLQVKKSDRRVAYFLSSAKTSKNPSEKNSVVGIWIPDRPLINPNDGEAVFIFNNNKFSYLIRGFNQLETIVYGTYDDIKVYLAGGTKFDSMEKTVWSYELIGKDQLSIEFDDSFFVLLHREKIK